MSNRTEQNQVSGGLIYTRMTGSHNGADAIKRFYRPFRLLCFLMRHFNRINADQRVSQASRTIEPSQLQVKTMTLTITPPPKENERGGNHSKQKQHSNAKFREGGKKKLKKEIQQPCRGMRTFFHAFLILRCF